MKFRKFKQNKLWRDKAIERLEQSGSRIYWKQLNDAEFADQLKIKLIEEVFEVQQAVTRQQLLEELADVLEVISSFCDVHGFTMQDIIALRDKKRQERGGFRGRKFVTIAEHRVGSYGEKYCLADPEKYPEIE